jgi:hypothetical protein
MIALLLEWLCNSSGPVEVADSIGNVATATTLYPKLRLDEMLSDSSRTSCAVPTKTAPSKKRPLALWVITALLKNHLVQSSNGSRTAVAATNVVSDEESSCPVSNNAYPGIASSTARVDETKP